MTGGVVHWVTEEACEADGIMRPSFAVVSLLPGELPQCSGEGVELRPCSAPFDDVGDAWDLVRALELARDVMGG